GQVRVEQQPLGELGKRYAIADGGEVSALALHDELAIWGNVAGYDRKSRGHGFHDAVRQPLEIAPQPENIERRQKPLRIVAMTEELDPLANLEIVGELLELRALGAIAHDDKIDFAVHDPNQLK